MSIPEIREGIQQIAADVTAFTKKLVETPSPSGEEKEVADLIVSEMRKLAFDEIFIDAMGNVVGTIKGSGNGENIMFNGHMDHAGLGMLDAWENPPFSASIYDGYLYGRGACDMKGGIASQVYASALIKKLGLEHRGDIIVTCVVQEEPAECVGIAYLCDVTLFQKGIKPDFVVVGEPTDITLGLGHRGRVELELKTVGQTSHASVPYQGINAVYLMLNVVKKLQVLDAALPTDKVFGKSTISLTNIWCSPGQLSIIPDLCGVNLDRRLAPDETVEKAMEQVEDILAEIRHEDSHFEGSVQVREVDEVSYTGMKTSVHKYMPSWAIASDHSKVLTAREALEKAGQMVELSYTSFGTDGSHTAAVLGIPTILYGPGEEDVMHTPRERLGLESLVRSVAGNAAIALAIVA